jgi:hypothetical protein
MAKTAYRTLFRPSISRAWLMNKPSQDVCKGRPFAECSH